MFLFLAAGVFAAVPIQDRSLHGAQAAEARLKVISAAQSYIGTPYRYGGISRGGLDCSGLVFLSFRDALNHTIPRTSANIYTWAEKISTAELQPGDLVFFVTTGKDVSHLGIYTGEGMFIHSASEGPRTGVMYSSLDESYWKRTYLGAGRALPWDAAAAEAMTAAIDAGRMGAVNGDTNGTAYGGNFDQGGSSSSQRNKLVWTDPGFFAGFSAAWTWGGFIEGAPSLFRGFTTVATVGCKWSEYRAGVELRPEWDFALGVFRLPITLSIGTDALQVFGGPAYTFGDPSLSLSGGERSYSGGGEWLWEVGISGAFPRIEIGPGALSLYSDLAWQPYHWEDGENFSFKPDFTANFRLSTGFRYLWRF